MSGAYRQGAGARGSRGGASPRGRVPRDGAEGRASVAPILSAVGLAIVAALTAGLFTGRLPVLRPDGGGSLVADRTPAPSDVVIVDPRSDVPGSIVYAKGGFIWLQSGSDARRLTSGGRDSMPTWAPDGSWIYYVETRAGRGYYPAAGAPRHYDLTYPVVVRIRPDGSGREEVATGRFTRNEGRYVWFSWIRQPVPDATGTRLAVVSDAPDPTKRNVVVQLLSLEDGSLRSLGLAETPPLGHQDPAWRPGEGSQPLLYVMNGRDGTRGAPSIWRWDPETKKSRPLAGPGYLGPAWAPSGRWIVATKQRSLATDLVILDASTGGEVARVTNDGRSWGAVWSPAGDAIAYLHISGGIVDLRLVEVRESGGRFQFGETLDLTQASGLDPRSRPSWFIPPDELPVPTPEPTPDPTLPASASPTAAP